MAQRIILISGSICSGKTTLSEQLQRVHGARVVKTRELIDLEARAKFRHLTTRAEYQAFGESLDQEKGGTWVSNALWESTRRHSTGLVIVDAVRTLDQVRAIRSEFSYAVFHLHLKASAVDLEKRFRARQSVGFTESASFADAKRDPTEASVDLLEAKADGVVDTSSCTPEDVFVRAATHLRLYARNYTQLVDVILGGQFGSEGKGNVASYLAREYDILMRGGGPNAGHKVYEDPRPYTHHQLPCGTRSTKSKIVIAPGAVISLPGILREIGECNVDPDRLSIDPQVMVISQADMAHEAGLVKKIGSTGQGVGAATSRRIMGRGTDTRLARDYPELRNFIGETQPLLEDAYLNERRILLEGTQGAGLSLYHGSYPHVTSRDTSVAACLSEAGIPPKRVRKVIMTCRTYPIRVQNGVDGTSGPLSREISWEEVARRSGLDLATLVGAEVTSTTGRSRRVSEFDWVQSRRAALLNGPTDIALTFADYLDAKNVEARRFEQLTDETIQFIEEVENVAAATVSLISTRFGFRSIIDRRAW